MECTNCNGSGEVKEHNFDNEPQLYNIVTCVFCSGTGEVVCPNCMREDCCGSDCFQTELEGK